MVIVAIGHPIVLRKSRGVKPGRPRFRTNRCVQKMDDATRREDKSIGQQQQKLPAANSNKENTVWALSDFILCTDRSQSQTTIITIRLPTLEAAQTSRGGRNKERGENITESLCDQMSQFRIAPSFSIEFENINDQQQQKNASNT